MALTPNTNEAFLREVDDELRRDQALDFWRKYGRALVAAIVVALIVFGGVLYWRYHQAQVAGAEGEQLQKAFDDLSAGRVDATQAPLADLAQSKSDGYRAIALFTQADVMLQKNDLKGAAAKFGQVAADTSVAKPFRDLALVRQTSAEFDTSQPGTAVSRLRGLAVAGSPWFGSAGELVAADYLRQGRRDLAGRMFGQIAKDNDVPDTIRQRAVQMAGVLGVDAVQSGDK